jgi:hypothetical protein
MNRSTCVAVFVCALGSFGAWAQVVSYTNKFTWQATQPTVLNWALSATDVLASDEITTLPSNESKSPGQTLTFPKSSTGFDFGFQLKALTVWPFTFRTDLAGALGAVGLTAAEVQAQNGSDWQITFTGGREVHAFGFNFIDNEGNPDQLRVYGPGDALMATFPGPFDKDTFLGVVSEEPITRVVMDDDPVDASFFNGLQFGYVPEPSGSLLAAVGMTGWLGRRAARRRVA